MTITGPEVFLMADDITRIEARLDRIETRITEINERIDHRIESAAANYTPSALLEERFKGQGERMGHMEDHLAELKSDKKWLNRMLMGAITVAILSSFGSMIVALVVSSG